MLPNRSLFAASSLKKLKLSVVVELKGIGRFTIVANRITFGLKTDKNNSVKQCWVLKSYSHLEEEIFQERLHRHQSVGK